MPCALDRAAAWIPDAATVDALTYEWPWESSFFPADNARSDVAGATGWACKEFRTTLDGGDQEEGGDGYPSVFDCRNDDRDIVPVLPTENGVDTEDCRLEVQDGCWLCPDGTKVADDGSSVDDDDSGGEEFPADDDDGEPIAVIDWEPGCSGCGFSWSCEDGLLAAVTLLPLGLRRRRPRTRAALLGGRDRGGRGSQRHAGRSPDPP